MKNYNSEEKLMLKQLTQAIAELLTKPNSKEEMDNKIYAQQYFFVDDLSENIHSFINICHHFDANPLVVRKSIIQYQLGEETNTELDSFTKNRGPEQPEMKTMREMITEEIESLETLIRSRVHGRLEQSKKRSAKGKRSKE